jgi:hypothetical protein
LGRAQRAANPVLPKRVLSAKELEGYPQEFWPFLRQLENGLIGMNTESCTVKPDMPDLYQV